ncbi:MAG: hypothetical protein JWQ95_4928 [Sphaerisporangium sp.]|nr:hypothetical protein [Sphaerisporangium sp.]
MARIRQAEGDLGGAFDLLDKAERLYNSDFRLSVADPIPLACRDGPARAR